MILFDAASGQQVINGPGVTSWTHTPINTPQIVIVNITWSSDVAGGSNSFVSSITYGGQAMTFLGLIQVVDCFLEKWALIGPLTGARTVTVTMGGTDFSLGTANSTTYYSSVSGSVALGTLDTQTDSVSPITNDVSVFDPFGIVDHGYLVFDGGLAEVTVTVDGVSETLRSGFLTQSGAIFTRRQSGTTSQPSTRGSITASASLSANRDCAIMSIELKEFVTGSPFFIGS